MHVSKWLLIAFSLSGAIAQAASFDCARAATSIEKQICADPILSKLDDTLAVAYREAAQSANPKPDLLQRQRQWLRKRAACKSSTCLETVYESRIVELDAQANCLQDLVRGECAPNSGLGSRLPRTVDGRLMLLTRRECRIGFDGGVETKSQAEAIQIHADCIEAEVYDPCDDAGGRWGQAQCAYAHLEVSKRTIKRLEADIRNLLRGQAKEAEISRVLELSGKNWQVRTDGVCAERDRRWPPVEVANPDGDTWVVNEPPEVPEGEAEPWGYCLKRSAAERADELQTWLTRLQASKVSPASIQAFMGFLSAGSTN